MKDIFIIDCQLFQTSTFRRGMGRYALGIINAVFEHNPTFFKDKKVICLYNEMIEEAEEWQPTLKSFARGHDDFEFAGVALETIDSNSSTKAACEKNRKLLGAFIDEISPDAEVSYFVPALLDDTIYACLPESKRPIKNIVLFHDLIPYLFADRYLPNEEKRERYFHRLQDVFKADILLCNSRTTANDLSRFLFIPHEKLHVIRSGNTNDIPELVEKKNENTQNELPEELKSKKFILSVSGDDSRKNNERMVAAFDQFNKMHDSEYMLVITSRFSEASQSRLRNLSDAVHFTGVVTNEQLEALYRNCECVLFVPEYEGLGLPILEALEYNRKMLVSDIEVFREISEDAVRLTDHTDIQAMAHDLNETVQNWKPEQSARKRVLDNWSWPKVADEWAGALKGRTQKQQIKKKNVAILMPEPTGISAIGRFVQSHHARFSAVADIVYYFESSPSVKEERVAYLPYVAECRSVAEFGKDYRTMQFDEIIYHLGNSDYHLATFQYALRFPGTVVIHDTDLSGLSLVSKAYGLWDEARYQAEIKLNTKLAEKATPSLSFSGSVVNAANKVIVHSEYAEKAVKSALVSNKPVAVRQLPMSTPTELVRKKSEGSLKVGMAGIINASKGTDILRLALEDKRSNTDVQYHLFGYGFAANYISLLKLFELGPVLLELDLADIAFQNRMAEMDVLLNYRPRYHGEASSATLEAMRYGVVPIVRDIGWFSQLPDNAVVKVKSADQVPSEIERLKNDRKRLAQMSRAAYEYIRANCHVDDYVEECVNGK